MHLLAAVVRTNQKRIQIEQWILLAIRCAIPAILALMMAKPVWQGAKQMLGEQPTSTAVLLDNSCCDCTSGGAGRRPRGCPHGAAPSIGCRVCCRATSRV